MKYIYTTCMFLLSLSIFAQEAGKVGELLKNEVGTEEIQTQRNNEPLRKKEGVIANSKNRKNPRTKYPIENGNNGYRWHNNYGNSEVFLRIPENGNFTVEIDDQMISNATGKFRFFDLRDGNIPISIYENNYLIYRARLIVKSNTRTVLDFFSDYGLYLLGKYPLQNQSYGINEWDDIWNTPYAIQNGTWQGNNGSYYGHLLSNQEFNNLITVLDKKTGFDSGKIEMISSVAKNARFTSKQIQSLVKSLSFENNRLQIAKELYLRCVDKQNFFLVYDAFDFESSRRSLSEFISAN